MTSDMKIHQVPERPAANILRVLIRVILGAVFLYASFDKIIQPAAFAKTIANYQILPDILTHPAAIILPWLEVIIGLALLLGFWLPGSVFLANLLLVSFMGALSFNMARGLNIYCGCFTSTVVPGEEISMGWYLLRDGIFLTMGFILFSLVFFRKDLSE